MRAQVIAITNQKGGVGKTTTAINLATGLAAMQRKTLLIDLDAQGNASTGLGLYDTQHKCGTYEAITGAVEDIYNCIHKTSVPCLEVMTASRNLSATEIELAAENERESFLKANVGTVQKNFDYIVIDCPPALGLLTLNAFTFATHILIPLQCEYYALEGLSHLLNTVKQVKKTYNPSLNLLGIVLTMYDKRSTLCLQVEEDVRKNLKKLVFESVIPRNVKISEAPSHGQAALIYDITCSGSQAYIKLTAEILKKMRK